MARKHQNSSAELKAKLAADHPHFWLIQNAYSVFDRYKPLEVEVCTDCCMDPEVAAKFFRPDIQDLPLTYLRDWFDAACAVEGISKNLWAYLLPRIFEVLLANEEPAMIGLEVALSRFDTGNPGQWTEQQWMVIDEFQQVYLASGIGSQEAWAGNALDDVLCMFRRGGWPLKTLLEEVQSKPDSMLAARLWQDWCSGYEGPGSIRMTYFWENAERPIVFGFYTSDALRSRMENLALSDQTDSVIAKMASDLVQTIETHA